MMINQFIKEHPPMTIFHGTTATKWLITAGAFCGTLAGWMALASGSMAVAQPESKQKDAQALDALLGSPLPTLAARLPASKNALSRNPGLTAGTSTPRPTLRSVIRPTAVPQYYSSGGFGGSAPVTSSRSSK
jgi:hypothetical protein